MTLFDPTLGGVYPTHPGLSDHSILEHGQLMFRPAGPDTVISIPVSGGGGRQTAEAWGAWVVLHVAQQGWGGRERRDRRLQSPDLVDMTLKVWFMWVLWELWACCLVLLLIAHCRIIRNEYRCEGKTCYGGVSVCLWVYFCVCVCVCVCCKCLIWLIYPVFINIVP